MENELEALATQVAESIKIDEALKALETTAEKEIVSDDNKPALEQYADMGFTVLVADYNDGKIMEDPDTLKRVFVSPSYITSDPVIIENMVMKGISPAETQTATMQDQFIKDNPKIADLTTAVQGIPLIGSFTDEAVGLFNEDAAEAMGSRFKKSLQELLVILEPSVCMQQKILQLVKVD